MRRLVGRRFEKGARVEPHQAAVAVLTRGQQNNPRLFELLGASRARERVLIGEIDRERTAYDRLDPCRRHLVGEFAGAEHVVGVGERERGLAVSLGEFAQPRDRQRALEQRIGRVHVQMDEAGHSTPRFSTLRM